MSELIMEDWKLKARTVVKLYRTRSVSLRKENSIIIYIYYEIVQDTQ